MTAPTDRDGGPQRPLVDWRRLGRRLGVSALLLLSLAVVAWLVTGAVTDGIDAGELPNFIGLAVAGMFLAEVVFVGGTALRGMLRAGERGDRLAGGDVGILPPQVRRRWRRAGGGDHGPRGGSDSLLRPGGDDA